MNLLYVISLLQLSRFSALVFKLALMCLCMGFFVFILLEGCWVLWMCRLFFSKFGKVLDIISSNNFPVPFSQLSFWESHYVYDTWWCLTDLCSSIYFSFFCFSDWIISTDLSAGSLTFSSAIPNLLLKGSSEFLISIQNFHFFFILLFYWESLFICHRFL